jgi:HAMP domain-containing protein
LGAESPAIAPVVESMLNKGKGTQEYVDENGQRWMVSFTVIDTTDWHLGLVLPYDEIIQPAVSIASRGGAIAIALVAVVIVVAILLAQIISRPIKRLSETAQRVEASVDQENISTEEFDTSSEISGTREIAELHSAFGEMVNALQKRMNELRSLYAIGQAITSNVEYEDTLNAVLSAVEEVVKYDAAEVSVLRGQKLVVEAWNGRDDFNDTKGREYKVGKGSLVGVIAETEDTLFMPTVEYSQNMNLTLGYDQSLEREFLDRTSKIVIESFLGIPLLVGDRIIGTLTLVHHEAEHFTEDDRRQLNKLAAQASIAIDNALKVRARELNLQRQIQELKFEIDEAKKEKQVEEIVETEYFQNLRARAKKIRGRNRGGDEETQEETQEENADET